MSNGRLLLGRLGCVFLLTAGAAWADSPRNVVFMIGDGMGFNHVAAAGMYLNGTAGTLNFESMPYQAQVTTYSANSSITDSAAAATALATGNKVNNGVISVAVPGDQHELLSLLEVYKARGARIGLLTTDGMTGATPGAFGAHELDRSYTSQIAADYLNQTRPNILLGGGGGGLTTAAALAAGYTVVTDRPGMQAIDTNTVSMLSGQFGSGSMPYEYDGVGSLPHLSQMVVTALDLLDNDPDGLFLLVEGGNIDHAAHSNDIARDVYEVVEFNNTVQVVLNWAAGRTDTLVLVTADHETGGLSIVQNNGQGNLPTVSWSTTGHSAANVGAWAWGMNAECVGGTLDNTQFFTLITNPQPALSVTPAMLAQTVRWHHPLPPQTGAFTVRNAGLGTMDYAITSDSSWMWTVPDSGTCTTETDSIDLVYDTALLAPGTYVGHLQVTSAAAGNSPQTITVTLTVKPVPGDFDSDEDVDQEDFAHLQICLASTDPQCASADLTGNLIIDQLDLAVFKNCYSGPNVEARFDCAD